MARGASRTPSRKKTAQRSAPAGSTGLPGWTKGLLYIAIGFGIAYFAFGKKESSAPSSTTPPLVTPVQSPAATKAGKPAATTKPPASPEAQSAAAQQTPAPPKKSSEQSFDFYTILPSSEITPTSSTPMPRVAQSQVPATATMPGRPTAATTPAGRPADAAPASAARPATPTSPMTSAQTSTPASGGAYILQSLSTGSQEGANATAARLRDLGLPTQVRAVQLANGKTTYRVQSGPFPEGAERDRALGLIRVQHLDPMVIRVR